MDSRKPALRPGEASRIATTILILVVVFLGFNAYTFLQAGDGFAFLAAAPIAFAAGGVVGGWVSAIRVFGAEEQEHGTTQAAEPFPQGHVLAAHG